MNRVNYSIVFRNNKMVLIRDDFDPLNPTVTVTNAAEDVVLELTRSQTLGERRLFYYDTDGAVDELLHNSRGDFSGFAPGNEIEINDLMDNS